MKSEALSPKESTGWVLVLPRGDSPQLAALRLFGDVEIAEGANADFLWVRGKKLTETLEAVLHTLPAVKRFVWQADDWLRAHGSRLAAERCPALVWQPLTVWLRVALPTARLPAAENPTRELTLVADDQVRSPNAAVLSLHDLVEWASTAPLLRLNPLRFAVSDDQTCLVLGSPIPSTRVRQFVNQDGIIVPAGLVWFPHVSAITLRSVLGVTEDTVVLWDERGLRLLSSELFIPVSRAAVRATLASFISN